MTRAWPVLDVEEMIVVVATAQKRGGSMTVDWETGSSLLERFRLSVGLTILIS